MARKATTKSGITNRSKQTTPPVQPVTQAGAETVKSAGNNGGTAGFVPGNFEEEIRRRAYELYERRATAGAANGDENQDWLIAEQEVLSLLGDHGQHSA